MISLTSPVETAAHRWPAGLKLALLCGATVALFALESLIGHLSCLALMFTLYALPGIQFLRSGLRRLWMLWPFVVIIVIWHILIGSTQSGLVIVLRMITAVGIANLVTMTTRLSDMMQVVRWLLSPLRRLGVNTQAIEMAMALVVRFTPVLAIKGRALSMAWRARSARRVGWQIVTPFAVLAIDDAEHVAEALRARGGI